MDATASWTHSSRGMRTQNYASSYIPQVASIRIRGTSLMRNSLPLGPYNRYMPRALCWSWGGKGCLMREVPL